MQGRDDEFDDVFRAPPHPDDRLWRHPAEVAADAARAAAAEAQNVDDKSDEIAQVEPDYSISEAPTVELPKPEITTQPPRRRSPVALLAAASVLLVGGGAMLAGVFSSSQTTVRQAAPAGISAAAPAPIEVEPIGQRNFTGPGPELTTELLPFVPRVQAVHATDIREGGGFFLTTSGHLATSASLVDHAEYVVVWTDDQRRWPATVIGSDAISDVALLHIATDQWPAAALAIDDPDPGASSESDSANYAIAVDYETAAMSVNQTETQFGTVIMHERASAPRLFIEHHPVPGAPVVDTSGAILAMTNYHPATDPTASMATPAWLIERVALDMLIEGGTTHPWLGAEIGFDDDTDMMRVNRVMPDSPAEEQGLQSGDLIDTVDGEPIETVESLLRAIYEKRPGDELVLSVTRSGGRRIMALTLGQIRD